MPTTRPAPLNLSRDPRSRYSEAMDSSSNPVTALPTTFQQWPLPSSVLRIGRGLDAEEVSLEQVRHYASDKAWVWPARLLLFFCDIHADTDAFLFSLEASGGVQRT